MLKKIILLVILLSATFAMYAKTLMTKDEFLELCDLIEDSDLDPECYSIINHDTSWEMNGDQKIVIIGPDCKKLSISHSYWDNFEKDWKHYSVAFYLQVDTDTQISWYSLGDLPIQSLNINLKYKQAEKRIKKFIKQLSNKGERNESAQK